MEQSEVEALFTDLMGFLRGEPLMREFVSDNKDVKNARSPLHDFSKGFGVADPEYGGVRDSVPAAYAQECLDLEKKQRKDDSTFDLGGTIAGQWDSTGRLTLIGAGRQHLEFTPAMVNQLLVALLAHNVPAPPQVIDANTDLTIGQMSQNDKVLLQRKMRGY